MRRLSVALAAAAFALAPSALAQPQASGEARARSVQQQPSQQQGAGVTMPKPPPAPASVKARYEGGVAGYAKGDGTLAFDDTNRRLVFRDKKGREIFSVSYSVVHTAWADVRSQRSTAGTAIGMAPYGLGFPGLWMKNTTRYLNLQYRDPSTRAEGAASFKLANRETLASVLHTFAEKAGLTQRGDYFTRNVPPTVRTNIIDN
jgi:hypothetical protein